MKLLILLILFSVEASAMQYSTNGFTYSDDGTESNMSGMIDKLILNNADDPKIHLFTSSFNSGYIFQLAPVAGLQEGHALRNVIPSDIILPSHNRVYAKDLYCSYAEKVKQGINTYVLFNCELRNNKYTDDLMKNAPH